MKEYVTDLETSPKLAEAQKIQETLGYGNCPDCIWYGLEEGCNVERDSPICNLNRRERNRGKEQGK